MGRKTLKKVTQPGSDLDLPLISFRYEDTGHIYLRVVDPMSLGRREGDVTGFEIVYRPAYTVEHVNKNEFDKWLNGKFRRLLTPTLTEVFKYDIDLKRWFPFMRSYDIRTSFNAVSGYWTEDLQVSVSLTVRFSKGVPYGEFIGDFLDFLSIIFDEKGHFEDVDKTIEALISEEFPQAIVSSEVISSPTYRLFTGETKSEVNPRFIDITIRLKTPLDEKVVDSLADSSNERDFALKFAMYIDPSNVDRIYVSGTKRSNRYLDDINEVKRLLVDIASLQGT